MEKFEELIEGKLKDLATSANKKINLNDEIIFILDLDERKKVSTHPKDLLKSIYNNFPIDNREKAMDMALESLLFIHDLKKELYVSITLDKLN